jgi:spore coat protein U-like protein
MLRKFKVAFAVALAALALSPDTFASSAVTGTMYLSAGIGTTCLVQSSTWNFGSSSSTAAPISATPGVFLTCSNGIPVTIDLGPGTNPTTGNTARQLANGSNRLAYNLYTTNAYTQVWGSTMSGGITQFITGTGAVQSLNVYFQIPATTPTPPTGLYSDSVLITAIF